ncbi:MAG TPA: GNAT family N-acetyltransferase [Acidimicrobiia bacterium]|jgi:hypothetical protein|nr:GNAT family N-acetyltransferase [Acidimicrobiia bacterium]
MRGKPAHHERTALVELALTARAWDEVIASDPDALVTQTRPWMRAIVRMGGWRDASRLFETERGRILLPLVRRRGTGGWAAIEASHPHALGFGGLVAELGVTRADVHAVLDRLATERRLRISIRPNPIHTTSWSDAGDGWWSVARRAQVVDLREGTDALWTRLHPNARRGIRRAERNGVIVTCTTAGESLRAFFALMHESRERWARGSNEPVWLGRWRARHDSLARWQTISDELDGRCRVYTATWNDTLVAATIVLAGPNSHYTRGAMRKDLASQCSANYALHWTAITDATAEGHAWYHLGESGTSTSLTRFKSQFGAATFDYAELRRESLPITSTDARARAAVKRMIRFRDPS